MFTFTLFKEKEWELGILLGSNKKSYLTLTDQYYLDYPIKTPNGVAYDYPERVPQPIKDKVLETFDIMDKLGLYLTVEGNLKHKNSAPTTPSQPTLKSVSFMRLQQVKEKDVPYPQEALRALSPEHVNRAIRTIYPDLEDMTQEHYGILTLNTKNHITGIHVVSIGTLNSTITHPRDTFKAALMSNSASIIMFHNHPSGDTEPSSEDISMTERFINAGKLLGIDVLDHMIIGTGYYSLRANKEYLWRD